MGACCSNLPAGTAPADREIPTTHWLKLAVALVISGLTMTFSLGVNLSPPDGETRWILHGILAVAVLNVFFLLGGPILKNTFRQLKAGKPGMDALFLLGIGGAFAASLHSTLSGAGDIYYEVVAILLAIYTVGSTLGNLQRQKAFAALDRLRSDYSQARTCCGNMVKVTDIQSGDRVKVFPGEAIAIDGTIVEGRATVTETALTGEPYAVVRQTGDRVLAGSRCHDGTLLVRATVDGRTRQLDGILTALDRARLQDSRLQSQADRLSQLFLPAVTLIALLTFLGWNQFAPWTEALFHALAVIVVACPCALGLATPLALWSTLYRLRQFGITARTTDWIERIAQTDVIVFDKTGTLTDSQPVLVDWKIFDAFDRRHLQGCVASVERQSDHPLAALFSDWEPGPPVAATDLLPGKGIAARFPDGSRLEIGNDSLLSPEDRAILAPSVPDLDPHYPGRLIYFRFNGKLAGYARYRESLRLTAAELTGALRQNGYDLLILTGDSSAEARHWPQELDIPVETGLTPADKTSRLRDIQESGTNVLYIGDGINDAPAFTTAHATLAIEEGSPVARETAQAVLSGHRIENLLPAIELCRRTVRTIRGNLLFAAGYNLIGISLAVTGLLHPVHAALLMLASSATVTYRAWKMAEDMTATPAHWTFGKAARLSPIEG